MSADTQMLFILIHISSNSHPTTTPNICLNCLKLKCFLSVDPHTGKTNELLYELFILGETLLCTLSIKQFRDLGIHEGKADNITRRYTQQYIGGSMMIKKGVQRRKYVEQRMMVVDTDHGLLYLEGIHSYLYKKPLYKKPVPFAEKVAYKKLFKEILCLFTHFMIIWLILA